MALNFHILSKKEKGVLRVYSRTNFLIFNDLHAFNHLQIISFTYVYCVNFTNVFLHVAVSPVHILSPAAGGTVPCGVQTAPSHTQMGQASRLKSGAHQLRVFSSCHVSINANNTQDIRRHSYVSKRNR